MSDFAEQLAPYGYSVDSADQILTRRGTDSGVFLTRKKGRAYARCSDKTLIWSGADVGDFVAWFWYAEKTVP